MTNDIFAVLESNEQNLRNFERELARRVSRRHGSSVAHDESLEHALLREFEQILKPESFRELKILLARKRDRMG